MCELSMKYLQYGWDRNMGYGTKLHAEAIMEYGITEHHRKSFKPIKNYIYNFAISLSLMRVYCKIIFLDISYF